MNSLTLNIGELNALLSVAITILITAENGDNTAVQKTELCYGARTLLEQAKELAETVDSDVREIHKSVNNTMSAFNKGSV